MKKGILIFLLIFIIPFALATLQYHTAEDILNGTFAGPGNYTFPNSLFIMAKLGIGMSAPTELLNIKLTGDILDGSGAVIYNSVTGKIPATALPYEAGDIVSDWESVSYSSSNYDVSQLSEGNVKDETPYGRGYTGTLKPGGTATTSDVKQGVTFYSGSFTEQVGAFTIGGDAISDDVLTGKKFYAGSFNELTGTYVPDPGCEGVERFQWESTGVSVHKGNGCGFIDAIVVGVCGASNVGKLGWIYYYDYSEPLPWHKPPDTSMYEEETWGYISGGGFGQYRCHRICDIGE